MTGRMLSPDPIVQSPFFSQNHNRHSYCLNNPLAFTDPTGLKIVYDMTDEEKAEWDEYINSIDENSPFMQLIEILDKEKQIITIEFGETVSDGYGNICPGQFNVSNYTITFDENRSLDYRVIAEEFYHAYQELNKFITIFGTWNREYEAKLIAYMLCYSIENYAINLSVYDNIHFFVEASEKVYNHQYFYFLSPKFVVKYLLNGYYFTTEVKGNANYTLPVINVPLTIYKLIYEIKW